jgi:hypothetical protein
MYVGGQANADEPSTPHRAASEPAAAALKGYETSREPPAATGGNKNMAYYTFF